MILLVDGTYGAVRDALAALDARALVERELRCGAHRRMIASADELKGIHTLQSLTDLDTASALDAFLGIKDDRARGAVLPVLCKPHLKRLLPDTILDGKALQLTLVVAGAHET